MFRDIGFSFKQNIAKNKDAMDKRERVGGEENERECELYFNTNII